jgi:hydrogenase expression/formation protein HypE
MTEDLPDMQGPICPIPIPHQDQILIGHGSGGKLSLDLIKRMFLPPFDNPSLRAGDDAGVVSIKFREESGQEITGRLAISTDSHVVWPLFFSGGDIGRLAVCGTVNDVSMMGARPLFMTAGFVLEEGLDMKILSQVVASMQAAAKEAGVTIVAGDTKVVQRGKADGMYINTTGLGIIPQTLQISGSLAKPGDSVILSGTIGDHGIAVLEARGELGFQTNLQSDIAPLNHLVQDILESTSQIHVFRDPTRGGLATSLNEIAKQSGVSILISENKIPVKPAVRSACELLGFDPLFIANEGKLVAIAPKDQAESILTAMHANQYGEDAIIIGQVISEPPGRVLMKTEIGSTRIIDIPSGEILPRIC